MYAVGRYISQGVYTVAGPFHPFGGAVDIIVVEQQDGTFKSTPWNVRFGKFQGVLKRSEKTVDIAVNDVQADFHMYMDNTGEAYFLKDAEGIEKEAYLLKDAKGADKDDNPLPSPSAAASCGDDGSGMKSPKHQEGQEGKESWYPTPDGDDAKRFVMKDSSDDEAEDDVEEKGTGMGNSLLLRSENSVGLPHQFELLVGFPDEDSIHAVTMQKVSMSSNDPTSSLDLPNVVDEVPPTADEPELVATVAMPSGKLDDGSGIFHSSADTNYVPLVTAEPELSEAIHETVSELEDVEASRAGEEETMAAEKVADMQISLCRH